MVAFSLSHSAQPGSAFSVSFFLNRPRFGAGRALIFSSTSFRWEDCISARPRRFWASICIFRCLAQNPFWLTSSRVVTSITDPPRKYSTYAASLSRFNAHSGHSPPMRIFSSTGAVSNCCLNRSSSFSPHHIRLPHAWQEKTPATRRPSSFASYPRGFFEAFCA